MQDEWLAVAYLAAVLAIVGAFSLLVWYLLHHEFTQAAWTALVIAIAASVFLIEDQPPTPFT